MSFLNGPEGPSRQRFRLVVLSLLIRISWPEHKKVENTILFSPPVCSLLTTLGVARLLGKVWPSGRRGRRESSLAIDICHLLAGYALPLAWRHQGGLDHGFLLHHGCLTFRNLWWPAPW